jgi:hypothetical protein
MNDDASAADRLPLPPMTPHAMRAAHGTAGDLAERSREHAPLLPPFVPGRAPARWRVPFPPQRPHAAVAAPVAEPSAPPAVPIVPEAMASTAPFPPAEAIAPSASIASDPVGDRMPWELDDDAGQDTAAAHDAPFAAPVPFPEPVVPAPQPDPAAQEPAAGFEPWDPSQLWDDPPFGRPAEPAEFPPAAAQATPPAGHPSVADRVAARLENLAAEVRASGIGALGAADDADELSRLLAGVVAGFLARDTPNG